MNRPVLIHVKTIKGKGYPHAEERPWDYHGVSAFDLTAGSVNDMFHIFTLSL